MKPQQTAPAAKPLPPRTRRAAVLAMRLPRFLANAIPRHDPAAKPPHACNTELTSNCV